MQRIGHRSYLSARRGLFWLPHQFIRHTVRFRLGRRAWLRAATLPSLILLRKELIELRVFPDTVTASLDALGVRGRPIKMLVGSPWDQVAAQIWANGAGAYEQPVSGLIAALGRTSKRALVVGANTGFYCLLLALEPNRPQVDAVEPWAPAVERLRQNLELNNVTDGVVVWPVAAGPNNGTMILRVPPPLSEDWPFETSASLSATYKSQHQHQIEVPVTTINTIRESSLTPIDLIIVDAEGFDHEVLKGAEHTVASDRPIIFTEVSPTEQDSLNALLERWGYVTVELEPSGLILRDRIVRPSRTMGLIPDSGEGDAEWWISVMLPPSRFADLAAAAAECSLPIRGASKLVAPNKT